MILLDTNVVSEALKPEPTGQVIDWLNLHFANCAISSIVVFELNAGVAILATGRRRDTLTVAVARAVRRFGPRIYPFDTAAAEAAARLIGVARAAGLGIHQVPAKLADLQTAGIAIAYGLQLATRNVGDFQGLGLDLVDPWSLGKT
jgi:predicted nucleic acid-binding protein